MSDEIVFNLKGQRFRRLEMRISGTVEGFAVKQGPRTEYFNDAPDFVFAQSGNNGPRLFSGASGLSTAQAKTDKNQLVFQGGLKVAF